MLKEEYIYLDCKITMSGKAMADLLYAAIITRSGLPAFHGIGIYGYDRSQNSRNRVDVKVFIHPSMIKEFEQEANVKFTIPMEVKLN